MNWPKPAQKDLGKNKGSFPKSKTILLLINESLPNGDRGWEGEGDLEVSASGCVGCWQVFFCAGEVQPGLSKDLEIKDMRLLLRVKL